MIQCKWAQLLFNIFHFQFWQVILTLESDAVVSVVCFIYFSSPNFRTSVIVREAAKVWPGNIIRAFTSNTTLPKIWNLRNLFHAWRRNVKYQRLGLKEVNVTFITYFSEEKQQRKIWKIELVWHFFSFISLLGHRDLPKDWQPHKECVWFPGCARFVCRENWSDDNTAHRLSRSCHN